MTRFILLLAAALALSGCAADLSHLRSSPAIAESAKVENLKGFSQDEHQCGASALATLLCWAAPPGETPQSLAPLVYTPKREGTFFFDLAREARLRSLLAYFLPGGLKEVLAEIAAGRPVLVLENRGLWLYSVYHYSVASGYDLGSGEITLYEGAEEPEAHSLSVFSRTFARSGNRALLVLPPGDLPVSDYPVSILSAISDLEKTSGVPAALPFYEAFLVRFPSDWAGRFALGNAYYSSGRKDEAGKELAEAMNLAPERPEPPNNLALLLFESGKVSEARKLAKTALENARKSGADPTPYISTLHEVGGEE